MRNAPGKWAKWEAYGSPKGDNPERKQMFYRVIAATCRQQNMSNLNLIGTNVCVQNRQIFCLYMLNQKTDIYHTIKR